MAKAPARLKVFQAQFGFYDTVVAAPSKAAALRAWGTHQDLFATGHARLAEDPGAVAAALAHPGTPLKRTIGTTGAFALEARGLPRLPDAPKRPAGVKAPALPKPRSQPAKPPADRGALNAAEAALRKLDDARKAEEAAFRRRRDELAAAEASAQAAYVEARRSATSRLVEARQSYRKAGGRD